jgi:hypothetical protein
MHDIALLRLSEPLVFNPFIRSICLPSVHDIVKYGERTLVTGWGATQGRVLFIYKIQFFTCLKRYGRLSIFTRS